MGVKCVRVIMTRAREEDGQYEHLVLTHMTYRYDTGTPLGEGSGDRHHAIVDPD